jgi:hypothetical protein
MRATVLTILLSASLLSCAPGSNDGQDISRTDSSIHVADGEHAGDLHSVNGSIEAGNHAVVAVVKTVNGSVRLGDDCRAKSLSTVNGTVNVGKRTIVDGDAMSVNGRISLFEDTVVRGTVKNINDGIVVGPRAHVGGKIVSSNSDIALQEDSRVDGGIRVKEEHSNMNRRPLITIGPGAKVDGELVFERDVELRVHTTAKIGKVTGASVESY